MLPPGHLGASYILIRSISLFGYYLSFPETLAVLASSVILDFDLIPAAILKKSHHDLASHTPLGVLIIWLVIILLFGDYLSPAAKTLILLSLFLHLVLDELGFWLCKLKLQEISKERQINWLYPLTKSPDREIIYETHFLDFSWLGDYVRKAKANVFLEIVLSIIAVLLLGFTLC
jgi:hypothetical protein